MLSPLFSLQQIEPNTPASQLWQAAKSCLKLGRINQSLTLAYSAAQKDPNQPQLYRNYYIEAVKLGAEFAEEIGDYQRASYYWEQLIQQVPQDGEAWYGLGIAKANLGDYGGAERALLRTLELVPGNQKARMQLREIQEIRKG